MILQKFQQMPPGLGWIVALYLIFSIPLLIQGVSGSWGLLINGYTLGALMIVAAIGLTIGKRWGWYFGEVVAVFSIIIWGNVVAQQLSLAPHDIGKTIFRICVYAAVALFLLRRQVTQHFAVLRPIRGLLFCIFASLAFAVVATVVEVMRAA